MDPFLGQVEPRSTLPRTVGPRVSTFSRMSGLPPEQVDPPSVNPSRMDRLLGAWMEGQRVL